METEPKQRKRWTFTDELRAGAVRLVPEEAKRHRPQTAELERATRRLRPSGTNLVVHALIARDLALWNKLDDLLNHVQAFAAGGSPT
jgi:hypothetical protein